MADDKPLPGGYIVGEMVYYIEPSQTDNGDGSFAFNGDRVVYGEQGEVKGPSPPGVFEGQLQIKFPNNKGIVHCRPAEELSRSPPPPLPGGYTLGEKVYYTETSEVLDNGDRLVHGEQGEVTGPGEEAGLLSIKFPNNKKHIDCSLDELSRSPPGPLPGGYTVGEKVYFVGASETIGNGDGYTSFNGDRVVHGEQGEVMGLSTGEWGENMLQIKFPNNKGIINCELLHLSRLPPPLLPGGYTVGEMIYFGGANQSFDNGDRLVHGEQGEVVGPSTTKTFIDCSMALNSRLLIKFPSNQGVGVNCRVDELSRSPPPPLPGGYTVGEKVYFLGANETQNDGERLVHGEQGEVMGPSIKYGGSLRIKFPINKRNISCVLPSLSRSPPPPLPGGYKAGEKLYYIGAGETVSTGDRIVYGEQGEVMGPAVAKRLGEERLAIKFPNNKGLIACLRGNLSRSPPPPLPGGYTRRDGLFRRSRQPDVRERRPPHVRRAG